MFSISGRFSLTVRVVFSSIYNGLSIEFNQSDQMCSHGDALFMHSVG